MRAITEGYERRLWEELNLLLADALPEDADQEAAERAILLAVTGFDTEIKDAFDRVRRLAHTERGYLRERMQEDNPVSLVQRRLAGAVPARTRGPEE
jgi:hypothetical protein